jgi:hypothetical protein
VVKEGHPAAGPREGAEVVGGDPGGAGGSKMYGQNEKHRQGQPKKKPELFN